jgi:transposase
MAYPRAKLTEFGRRLVVDRVLEFGWSPAQAAASTGVSRATVYKWIGRFKTEGPSGLRDRASRPDR